MDIHISQDHLRVELSFCGELKTLVERSPAWGMARVLVNLRDYLYLPAKTGNPGRDGFATEDVVESRDLDENTIMDLDSDGNKCAITFEHASSRTDVEQVTLEGIAA